MPIKYRKYLIDLSNKYLNNNSNILKKSKSLENDKEIIVSPINYCSLTSPDLDIEFKKFIIDKIIKYQNIGNINLFYQKNDKSIISQSLHHAYRYNLKLKKHDFFLDFDNLSIYKQLPNNGLKKILFDWSDISNSKLICVIYLEAEATGFDGVFYNMHINPNRFNPKHLGSNHGNINDYFAEGEGICFKTENIQKIFQNDIYIYPGCIFHEIGPTLDPKGRLMVIIGLN